MNLIFIADHGVRRDRKTEAADNHLAGAAQQHVVMRLRIGDQVLRAGIKQVCAADPFKPAEQHQVGRSVGLNQVQVGEVAIGQVGAAATQVEETWINREIARGTGRGDQPLEHRLEGDRARSYRRGSRQVGD